MYKSVLLTTTLLLAGTAQAAWTSGVEPYELDSNKEACVAKVETKHNDLSIAFPKDGQGYPLIKMTNKFEREYIAARLWLSNSRVRFFGKDSSGNIEFYMIPKSQYELQTFINIVKRNSKLSIQKLYKKNGKVTSSNGDFPLKGSSAALRSVQECLGGTLISSYQANLLREVVSKRANPISNDYRDNMEAGQKIFEGLRDWKNLEELKAVAFEAVRVKERDPRLMELEAEKAKQEGIIGENRQEFNRISDNEAFFSTADSTIDSLNGDIATSSRRVNELGESAQSQANRIAPHSEHIRNLETIARSARADVDSAQLRLDSAEEQVNAKRSQVSATEASLEQSRTRLHNYTSQTFDLEMERNRTRTDFENRVEIKRELEQRLYAQYGGSPTELSFQIEDLDERRRRNRRISEKASELSSDVSDIANDAAAITRTHSRVQNVKADLQCFKNNKGPASIKCLNTSIQNLQNRRNALVARRTVHQKNKCKRIFGIGKKKCKRRRDAAIRALNGQIAQVDAERAAIDQRIATIQSTGKDPLRKQSIEALKKSLQDLRTKRKQQIASTQSKIDNLRMGTMAELFPKVGQFKNCRVSVQTTCQRRAENTSIRLSEIAERRAAKADIQDQDHATVSANLNSLNQAIIDQVSGLQIRLFDAYKAAEAALTENQTAIRDEEFYQRQELSNLDFQRRELSSLSQEASRLAGNLRNAEDASSRASRSITTYKNSVGYNSLVAELENTRALLSEESSNLGQLEEVLDATSERRAEVANEIEGYPQAKEELTASSDAARKVIVAIQPELDQINGELENLRSEFEIANRNNRENQDSVKINVGSIRYKF